MEGGQEKSHHHQVPTVTRHTCGHRSRHLRQPETLNWTGMHRPKNHRIKREMFRWIRRPDEDIGQLHREGMLVY